MANPLHPEPGPTDRTCGDCVWRFDGGRGPAVSRCRRHGGQRIGVDSSTCVSFTPELDCLRCGACCREAYHAVEVGPRDPFVRQHPDRLVLDLLHGDARRPGIAQRVRATHDQGRVLVERSSDATRQNQWRAREQPGDASRDDLGGVDIPTFELDRELGQHGRVDGAVDAIHHLVEAILALDELGATAAKL